MPAKPTSAAVDAVAYLRVSTDEQTEKSIPEQRLWAQDVARERSLSLLREFGDPGVAGDEVERRPGLTGMLSWLAGRKAEGQPVATLLIWSQSRLARASLPTLGYILERLQQAGVRHLITQQQTYDLESDTDTLFLGLQGVMADRGFQRNLSENVARARARLAREGRWGGGPCPYGYRVSAETGKLEVLDDEARWVRIIFERYLSSDVGLVRLAAWLQDQGAPLPGRGRKNAARRWTGSAVLRILRCPIYLGDAITGRTAQGKHHSIDNAAPGGLRKRRGGRDGERFARRPREEWIVAAKAHAALVELADWQAVQTKIDARRTQKGEPTRTSRTGTYPLSGKCVCSRCGRTLVGDTEFRRGKAYVYLICGTWAHEGRTGCHRHGINPTELLPVLAEALRKALADPESLRRRLARRIGRAEADRDQEVKRLEKQAKRIEADIKQARINLARARKPSDQRAISGVLEGWEAELAALAATLDEARREAAASFQEEQAIDEALALWEKIPDLLSDPALAEESADVIRCLVDSIRIDYQCRLPEHPKGQHRCRPTGGELVLRAGLVPEHRSRIAFALDCP